MDIINIKNKIGSFILLICISWIQGLAQDTLSPAIKRDGILYQFGMPNAFMGGLYSGALSIGELKKHGDFGIGAPDKLDGELIMGNGRMYQTRFTGKTFPVVDSGTTCLFFVCYFKADTSIYSCAMLETKEAFEYIDSFLNNKNGMYAIRITGTFDYLKTRAFPPVTIKPSPDITALMDQQHFFEMRKIKGAFIGFKLPSFVDGWSIPGFHFHFISDEKSSGGHVTGFAWNNVLIEIEELHQIQVALPQTYEFRQFNFKKNRTEDLKRLENGK